MKNPIIGYDMRGSLFDEGDHILRVVEKAYFQQSLDIYDLYLKVPSLDIAQTSVEHELNAFRHRKYRISYPFEWTAEMFKDAALFHLDLFLKLDECGWTLKDALPNNIVFDATRPIFVDFLSFVKTSNLKEEPWGKSWGGLPWNRARDFRFFIIKFHFEKYWLVPLLAMSLKKHRNARELLLQKACHCRKAPPSLSDLLPAFSLHLLKELCQLVPVICNRSDFVRYCQRMKSFISYLDVSPRPSGYVQYYPNKKEDFNIKDRSQWKKKQLVVNAVLDEMQFRTVLDIGCNTGWFSFLAAAKSYECIAVDVDESCINTVYMEAKKNSLKVLPLCLSFSHFEREVFGIVPDDFYAKSRDFEGTPYFLAPKDRLASDIVFCLALMHHLILGQGYSVEYVLQVLAKLSKKVLILEYVALNDAMIVQGQGTFKCLNKVNPGQYALDVVINNARNHFQSIEIMDSDEITRKLLVMRK